MPRQDDTWETARSPRDYEAFQKQDKILATDYIRANGITWSPSHAYLLAVIFGHRRYTAIKLIYTSMIINLHGERLRDVALALKLRKCSMICEFSPVDHDPPADDRPIIRKIEIVVKSIPDMIAEGEQGLDR